MMDGINLGEPLLLGSRRVSPGNAAAWLRRQPAPDECRRLVRPDCHEPQSLRLVSSTADTSLRRGARPEVVVTPCDDRLRPGPDVVLTELDGLDGLMAVMLFVFGRHHPRTFDEEVPLDSRRKWLALFAVVMFILCFTPAPIQPIVGAPRFCRSIALRPFGARCFQQPQIF